MLGMNFEMWGLSLCKGVLFEMEGFVNGVGSGLIHCFWTGSSNSNYKLRSRAVTLCQIFQPWWARPFRLIWKSLQTRKFSAVHPLGLGQKASMKAANISIFACFIWVGPVQWHRKRLSEPRAKITHLKCLMGFF